MWFGSSKVSAFGRVGAAVALLALAVASAALAFPRVQEVLGSAWTNALLWGLLLVCAGMGLTALARRRWLSAVFHAGAAVVIVGGGMTAGYAKSWQVALVDSPLAPPEYRQRLVEGELVSLSKFEIETYADGMPKQFRTTLAFPEGERTLSVNNPLRRKGITYYQMSYSQATDPYGRTWWVTHLTLRRDPGAAVTFAGYGLLALAALGAAIRETAR